LRERGELPTGIKRQFVGDLLNERRCICGTELIEGTHAHGWCNLGWIGWFFRCRDSYLGAQADEIDKQAPEFWNEVDRQQANINQGQVKFLESRRS